MNDDGAALDLFEELVELDPAIERPVGTFSKGMRQRVKLAAALVHDPLVLMMDEPLNGLDPRQRRHMIELFHRLGDAGKTVLVSSHVLEEVERIGSKVVVIAKGRLAAEGDFRAIRTLMDDQPMRVRVGCSDAKRVAGALVSWGSVTGCTVIDATTVEVTTTDARRFRRAVLGLIVVLCSLMVAITLIEPRFLGISRVFFTGLLLWGALHGLMMWRWRGVSA